jgi:hypothetical protein
MIKFFILALLFLNTEFINFFCLHFNIDFSGVFFYSYFNELIQIAQSYDSDSLLYQLKSSVDYSSAYGTDMLYQYMHSAYNDYTKPYDDFSKLFGDGNLRRKGHRRTDYSRTMRSKTLFFVMSSYVFTMYSMFNVDTHT